MTENTKKKSSMYNKKSRKALQEWGEQEFQDKKYFAIWESILIIVHQRSPSLRGLAAWVGMITAPEQLDLLLLMVAVTRDEEELRSFLLKVEEEWNRTNK